MKPIQEAELIIRKETLTLEDYNRFIDLGKLIKDIFKIIKIVKIQNGKYL